MCSLINFDTTRNCFFARCNFQTSLNITIQISGFCSTNTITGSLFTSRLTGVADL